jgi:hypothetical protein
MYDMYSDLKQFLMSYEATISSYGGNTVVMANEILRHGSQERGSDVVFFPSPGNDHVMEKAKGHAGNQFSGFLDEASNCSSPIPVHTRP